MGRYLKIFELACLLHDLEHAPFSHTGEEYYLKNGKRDLLHNYIIELTSDEDLKEEIKSKNYKAAPHELMSVIVALRNYSFLFNDKETKIDLSSLAVILGKKAIEKAFKEN